MYCNISYFSIGSHELHKNNSNSLNSKAIRIIEQNYANGEIEFIKKWTWLIIIYYRIKN